MNVVVAGGAGYIGSFLVERLVRDGHTVTSLSRKAPGSREVHCDLANPRPDLFRYFKNADWVFHLAGRTAAEPSVVDPLPYFRDNVSATINLLEAIRKAQSRPRIIYASSAAIYGPTPLLPTPEEAPARPQNPFALTKKIAEEIVLHWGRVYKLPVVSLRLFSVYGPQSPVTKTYGAILTAFLSQKARGQPYTVYGDGSQKRDLLFVGDAVEAMILTARSNAEGEVFNVGSGTSHSLREVVDLLGGPVCFEERGGWNEIEETRADIRKFQRFFAWRPRVSLAEGIRRVLRTYPKTVTSGPAGF